MIETLIQQLTPVGLAMVSGISYSLYWYLNKVADPTDITKLKDLDPYPLLATGLTGAVIGLVSVASGGELTQVSVGLQIGSYVAVTAVIERGMKTIVRILRNKGWI